MGVLLNGRLDPAAILRRLEVLFTMSVSDFSSDVMDSIRQTEPDAVKEYDNYPNLDSRNRPIPPFPLCKLVSARVGAVRLLFVGGVYNADKGREVWDGYTGPSGFVAGLTAPTHDNIALNNFATLNPFWIGEPLTQRQIWVGYSAGGAALYYFGVDQHIISREEPAPEFMAFGCPAPVWSNDWHDNRWMNWVHIFNDNDPVPLIPPQLGYWQALFAGLTGAQGNRIYRFQKPPGGHQFTVDGHLAPTDTYPTNLPPPTTAIGEWLAAQSANRTTGHSLDSYIARARLHLLDSSPVVSNPPAQSGDSSGGEWGSDVPSVELVSTRRIRQHIAEAQESIINAFPRDVTEASVVIPAIRLFKAFRVGRIWYVKFGETTIATAPNKKRALGFARVGNDFLRRMQIEGEINPQALVQQLRLYCTAAEDPDGPFQPPLNVAPGNE